LISQQPFVSTEILPIDRFFDVSQAGNADILIGGALLAEGKGSE